MNEGYEHIAQRAYKAYGAVTEFKNYQGLPMPEWDALPAKIQEAWRAAVKEAVEQQLGLQSFLVTTS